MNTLKSAIARSLLVSSTIAGATLSAPTLADVVGGEVSVMYWNGGYGGSVTDTSGTQQQIELERDLGFDDSGFIEFSAAIEHPVPLLPNVKIKHIDLDESADGSLSVTFDGINFAGDVKTNLDLTHTSAVLYYEILDNIVSLDLGLEAKLFDGTLRIEETSGALQVSETKIDDPLPLLYVSADVELPLTGLTVGAEISGVSYSGDKIIDARAALRYGIGLMFLEAGYRTMQITVDDIDDIDVDADLSGAFLSAGIDF